MSNNGLLTVEMREAFFMALYKKAFPAVARHVARMGGSFEEAQDIFQDALVVYYEKVVSACTEPVANEKGYVLGIAKKLWLQHYRTNGRYRRLDDVDIITVAYEQPSAGKLLYYLATAGKKCMELLKACYYDALPPGDVAELFGYAGTHSATVAKYKCMEKVRDTVKQNSLSYADFIE